MALNALSQDCFCCGERSFWVFNEKIGRASWAGQERNAAWTLAEAVSVAPGAIVWIPRFFSKGTGGQLSGSPQQGSTQRKGSPLLQMVM
jgi:hypothetical protein